VCSDTKGGRILAGEAQEVPKVFVLPHVEGGAVLGGRGHFGFLWHVAMLAMMLGPDFDKVREDMPQLLGEAFKMHLVALERMGLSGAHNVDRQTIAACGWSERAGRMVGYWWEQEHRDGGFLETDFTEHGVCFGPWSSAPDDPWTPKLNQRPTPRTPAALLEVAREQMRMGLAAESAWTAGGKLLVAELARDRITIAPAGSLDEPAPGAPGGVVMA
jgi:hypothetical protein